MVVVVVAVAAGAAGVTIVVVAGAGVRFTETQPERASIPADKTRAMRMERPPYLQATQRLYLSESSIASGNGNGCWGVTDQLTKDSRDTYGDESPERNRQNNRSGNRF